MKETIFLVASSNGIGTYVKKSLPTNLRRGEVPIKVVIEFADNAFTPPVLEQHIFIENPYKGIDLEDVHFVGDTITETEAELIRQKRLEKAAGILEANGYKVEKVQE